MKTEPGKPLLSDLSEADKKSLYAEMSRKKPWSATTHLLVALLTVGTLFFIYFAFVLPFVAKHTYDNTGISYTTGGQSEKDMNEMWKTPLQVSPGLQKQKK